MDDLDERIAHCKSVLDNINKLIEARSCKNGDAEELELGGVSGQRRVKMTSLKDLAKLRQDYLTEYNHLLHTKNTSHTKETSSTLRVQF